MRGLRCSLVWGCREPTLSRNCCRPPGERLSKSDAICPWPHSPVRRLALRGFAHTAVCRRAHKTARRLALRCHGRHGRASCRAEPDSMCVGATTQAEQTRSGDATAARGIQGTANLIALSGLEAQVRGRRCGRHDAGTHLPGGRCQEMRRQGLEHDDRPLGVDHGSLDDVGEPSCSERHVPLAPVVPLVPNLLESAAGRRSAADDVA